MRFGVGLLSPLSARPRSRLEQQLSVCPSELVGGGMDHAPRERATHAIIQTEKHQLHTHFDYLSHLMPEINSFALLL